MRYFFLLALLFSYLEGTYNPQTNTYTVDSSGLVYVPHCPNPDHNQNQPKPKQEKQHGKAKRS